MKTTGTGETMFVAEAVVGMGVRLIGLQTTDGDTVGCPEWTAEGIGELVVCTILVTGLKLDSCSLVKAVFVCSGSLDDAICCC